MNIKKNHFENITILTTSFLLSIYERIMWFIVDPQGVLVLHLPTVFCIAALLIYFSFGYISSFILKKPITATFSLKITIISFVFRSIWSLIYLFFFNPIPQLEKIKQFQNLLNSITPVTHLIIIGVLIQLIPLLAMLGLTYIYISLKLGGRLYKRLHYHTDNNIQ